MTLAPVAPASVAPVHVHGAASVASAAQLVHGMAHLGVGAAGTMAGKRL